MIFSEDLVFISHGHPSSISEARILMLHFSRQQVHAYDIDLSHDGHEPERGSGLPSLSLSLSLSDIIIEVCEDSLPAASDHLQVWGHLAHTYCEAGLPIAISFTSLCRYQILRPAYSHLSLLCSQTPGPSLGQKSLC